MAYDAHRGNKAKSKKNMKLAVANGTSIAVKGDAELRFQGPSGNRCSMKFLDAGVKKPLASVSSMVDQGSRVVFDADGSYVEHVASSNRIPMMRKRGVFVLEIEAEAPGWTGSKRRAYMEVDGVDAMRFKSELGEEYMKDFRRQA